MASPWLQSWRGRWDSPSGLMKVSPRPLATRPSYATVNRSVSPNATGAAGNTTRVSPCRAVRISRPWGPVTLVLCSRAPSSSTSESSPARRETTVVVTTPRNDVESQLKSESAMRWWIRS